MSNCGLTYTNNWIGIHQSLFHSTSTCVFFFTLLALHIGLSLLQLLLKSRQQPNYFYIVSGLSDLSKGKHRKYSTQSRPKINPNKGINLTSDNGNHAAQVKLKGFSRKAKPVFVHDIEANKFLYFPSMTKASLELGISTNLISRGLKSGTTFLYKDKYLFSIVSSLPHTSSARLWKG